MRQFIRFGQENHIFVLQVKEFLFITLKKYLFFPFSIELKCGDVNFYCPRGSFFPTPVTSGFYSIGGNPDNQTRRDQAICPLGSYCEHAIPRLCPKGRYGNQEGLADSTCTDGCPPGYYCPGGSVNPIPCPDQSYSTGLTWTCTPCPGERTTSLKCQTEKTCCMRY